jgi:hypothetical protein
MNNHFRERIVVFLVAAGIFANSQVAMAVNLLVNGSFEAGTYSFNGEGAQSIPPGSTDITGWVVQTNTVAPIQASNSFGVVPQDANVCLDMQGYSDSRPYGAIEQTVTTIPGGQYQLSFWLGVQNDLFYSVGPASLLAAAGATSQTFTNSLSGPGNQWQQFSMPFTAAGATTAISFSGTFTQGGAYIGLDNADLELVAVPEPSIIPLLSFAAVFFLSGCARRHRLTPAACWLP